MLCGFLWITTFLGLTIPSFGAMAQPLRVAFIGGSITAGAGAAHDNGWAQMTADWLSKRPGGAVVRNIAIGATPSLFGLYRFDRDLGGFTPDLAFIEFAVNDPHDPTFLRTYTDALIGKFRQRNSRVRIVYVVTTTSGAEADQMAGKVPSYVTILHDIISQEGAVFVDAGGALWAAVRQNRITLEQALPAAQAGIHPSDRGHAIYFAEVQRVLGPLLDQAVVPQPTSLSIDQTGLLSATLLPIDRAASTGCRIMSFPAPLDHLKRSLTCGDGAEFNVDFSGSTIGLILGNDRYGGRLTCGVDGRTSFSSVDTTSKSTDNYIQLSANLLSSSLTSGQHRLTCDVAANSPDRRVIVGSIMALSATK
jgi:lysophospholipase L1-like esterase